MSTLVTGGGDLRLAAGTGTVQISAPTDTNPTGQSLVLTLPQTIGSANQVLKNSGTAGTLEFATHNGTQISTYASVADQSSSTSIEFENLPTDTVKIQVNWWEVGGTSYTGTEDNRIIVQLGTTGSHTYKTSGYNVSSFNVSLSAAQALGFHSANYEGASFHLWVDNEQENGHLEFTKVGGNRWVFAGQSQISAPLGYATQSTGSLDLGAAVTCLRLTTRGGTNTLPNGNCSVMTWSAP